MANRRRVGRWTAATRSWFGSAAGLRRRQRLRRSDPREATPFGPGAVESSSRLALVSSRQERVLGGSRHGNRHPWLPAPECRAGVGRFGSPLAVRT